MGASILLDTPIIPFFTSILHMIQTRQHIKKQCTHVRNHYNISDILYMCFYAIFKYSYLCIAQRNKYGICSHK